MVLFIPSGDPDDGDRGEEDVVGGVELEVVNLGAREK